MLIAIILLAFAVSLDGLGVGLACGMGRMKLPWSSLLLMGVASGGAILVSMVLGRWVGSFMHFNLATWIGGLMLMGLGAWMLWQARAEQRKGLLGLVDDPFKADVDQSGTISAREAMLLGLALAMDAFGAGFGAALAGFPPLPTGISVAIAKVVLVGGGLSVGRLVANTQWVGRIKILPGLIICILGLLKILFL